MGINSLEELCRKADGEIVGSSIRGAPPGSVRACKVGLNDTVPENRSVHIYESDIEGGDFMFGSPESFTTLITDVESVNDRGQETGFQLPGEGRVTGEFIVSRYY